MINFPHTPLAPWHWRSHALGNRTGADIFEALFYPRAPQQWGGRAIATLLESPTRPSTVASSPFSSLSRYSICAGAPRHSNGIPYIWTPDLGDIFPTLSALLKSSCPPASLSCPETLPFTGGWLGWLGYDAAWEIEQLPYLNPDPLPFPAAFWYAPDGFAVLDHWEQTLWLAATDPRDLDGMEDALTSKQNKPSTQSKPDARDALAPVSVEFVSNQDAYEQAVVHAKKHIQAGDIFQANLSLRFSTATQADSWPIYRALHTVNPSPFASYWHTPWGAVISCSPERLVQKQGAIAQTRPIAGTRPRGGTPDHDHALAQELVDNRKENAEHIMLVDLERNDLGRVCTWGSVHVDELLAIERYSHVMHLVSNIRGTVRSPYSAIDLIRALFPGGTITGCPKVRCMEIIEYLEPVRRSLFYGSCGYLDWRGNLDLNILIRTLLYVPRSDAVGKKTADPLRASDPRYSADSLPRQHNIVWGQIGAGIVADSEPDREWHESMAKAQAQLQALALVAPQHRPLN